MEVRLRLPHVSHDATLVTEHFSGTVRELFAVFDGISPEAFDLVHDGNVHVDLEEVLVRPESGILELEARWKNVHDEPWWQPSVWAHHFHASAVLEVGKIGSGERFGNGVIIFRRFLVTARHVLADGPVRPDLSIRVQTGYQMDTNGEIAGTVQVCHQDNRADIAVVRLEDVLIGTYREVRPQFFEDTSQGYGVVIHRSYNTPRWKRSLGWWWRSPTNKILYRHSHGAPLVPGSSGAGLYDSQGHLLGILNGARWDSTRLAHPFCALGSSLSQELQMRMIKEDWASVLRSVHIIDELWATGLALDTRRIVCQNPLKGSFKSPTAVNVQTGGTMIAANVIRREDSWLLLTCAEENDWMDSYSYFPVGISNPTTREGSLMEIEGFLLVDAFTGALVSLKCQTQVVLFRNIASEINLGSVRDEVVANLSRISAWCHESPEFSRLQDVLVSKTKKSEIAELATCPSSQRFQRVCRALWLLEHFSSMFRLPPYHFVGRKQLMDDLHETFALGEVQVQIVCGFSGFGKSSLCREYALRYCLDYESIVMINTDLYEHDHLNPSELPPSGSLSLLILDNWPSSKCSGIAFLGKHWESFRGHILVTRLGSKYDIECQEDTLHKVHSLLGFDEKEVQEYAGALFPNVKLSDKDTEHLKKLGRHPPELRSALLGLSRGRNSSVARLSSPQEQTLANALHFWSAEMSRGRTIECCLMVLASFLGADHFVGFKVASLFQLEQCPDCQHHQPCLGRLVLRQTPPMVDSSVVEAARSLEEVGLIDEVDECRGFIIHSLQQQAFRQAIRHCACENAWKSAIRQISMFCEQNTIELHHLTSFLTYFHRSIEVNLQSILPDFARKLLDADLPFQALFWLKMWLDLDDCNKNDILLARVFRDVRKFEHLWKLVHADVSDKDAKRYGDQMYQIGCSLLDMGRLRAALNVFQDCAQNAGNSLIQMVKIRLQTARAHHALDCVPSALREVHAIVGSHSVPSNLLNLTEKSLPPDLLAFGENALNVTSIEVFRRLLVSFVGLPRTVHQEEVEELPIKILASAWRTYGSLLRASSSLTEARKALCVSLVLYGSERVRSCVDNSFGVELGLVLNHMGRVEEADGKLDVAEQLYLKACAEISSVLTEKSTKYCAPLHNYANICLKKHRLEEALRAADEAVSTLQLCYGEANHHNVATSKFLLGRIHAAISASLTHDVVETREWNLGTNHADTSTAREYSQMISHVSDHFLTL